jgi:hypothetical protein
MSPEQTRGESLDVRSEIFSLGRELLDMVRGRPTKRPMKLIVGVVDVMPKYIAHWLIEPALRLGERVRIVCREATPEQLLAQLELEASIQEEMAGSDDFLEGVSAFVQKREARFGGR